MSCSTATPGRAITCATAPISASSKATALALVDADGAVELFLDSATDAERAELEAPGVRVHFAADIARAVGARLDRIANARLAAAPRRFMPQWLADPARGFKLDDATALIDKLLMHKNAGEIDAMRRAARIADEAYVEFLKAVRPGRRQYEIVADIEAHLRRAWLSGQFHDHRLGRQGRARHDAAVRAPDRGRRSRHHGTHTCGRKAISPRSAARWWWARRMRRSGARSRSTPRRWRRASPRCVRARARPTSRRPRTTCFANTVSANTPRANGRACAATAWGCSADSKPHILEDVNTVLEPGMTLIVHPNTYHPEAGYIVLGDAVLVTEGGVEVLCKTPRQLFEVAA